MASRKDDYERSVVERQRAAHAATVTDKQQLKAHERSAPLMNAFKDYSVTIASEPEARRLELITAWWRERGIGADFHYVERMTPLGRARILKSTTLWCVEDES